MTETRDERLKPCPFCGARVALIHNERGWSVMCDNDDCKVLPETADTFGTEQAALDAWNTRI